MIQSQAELEREIMQEGMRRAESRMEHNEQHGMAHNNEYTQPLYRRWVIPLQEMIQETLHKELGKPGRRGAHVALLKVLDPFVAAFCAVRVAIVSALKSTVEPVDGRKLASAIGNVLHKEMILAMFEGISPALFYEVTNDLDRRHSQSEVHRFNALMGAARNKEIALPRWQQQDREQIGMWMLEALRVLGFIDVQRERVRGIGKYREVFNVYLSDTAMNIVTRIKNLVAINLPYHLPCIEQPKDWTAFDEGGWHTVEMRRHMPFCVNIRRVRNTNLLDRIKQSDLSAHVIPAINHLQAVKWKINTVMLTTVKELGHSSLDLTEALSEGGPEAPGKPDWLTPGMKKENMTDEQREQFVAWKRAMSGYHTERKLRWSRWSRFSMATQVANRFKDYPALYFVYQADFRGRLYAQTTGVSPQGSDLQKSLLHFAEGKPLSTPEAVKWFKINGANRFGIDKATFEDRIAWVDREHKSIIEFADDPIGCSGWTEADSPMQFLAWAKEYAEWCRNPNTFLSRIPVGLDGSCNGLQHFSAMLRDPVGGRATNLIAAAKPNDIYTQVATVALAKLNGMNPMLLSERDREMCNLWVKHGISRSVVKRSVMTLPYGSTRYSCAEFITHDYLRHGLAKEFEPTQYTAAANFLSHVVWESIGEVVVSAAAAMSWLQQCAKTIIADGAAQIEWVTPSGFPVTQVYNAREEIRVNTRLFGGGQIRVHKDIDEPRPSGHKNGLAPNFVHSMDASHLTLTVNACKASGIKSLAMIHDDYGTHAADTQRLYEAIRETFVRMYEENDPIMEFISRYKRLPARPGRGELDLQAVLNSPFFFA